MKRFVVFALAAVMALGVTSAVYANICAFDPVPAATLLFPFVQLDYNNPVNGDTTLFSITNVSSSATIVHVTVWADDSSGVIDFNVVLSGYDVQTMNIRDILINGDLPNTGTDYPDSGLDYDFSKPINPIDGDDQFLGPYEDGPWSNNGQGPNPTDLFSSEGTSVFNTTDAFGDVCTPANPSYPNYPIIPASTLSFFQDYITYYQYYGTYGYLNHYDCEGSVFSLTPDDWWQLRNLDQPSWMYVTADVVDRCNKLFPYEAEYWAPEVQNDSNVLIGDVMWVNTAARFSEADTAVHIEADPYIANVATLDAQGNPITFYYDFTTGTDDREALPTAWAFRYMGAGTSDIDTYIRAWKNYNDFAPMFSGSDFLGFSAWDCYAYTYYAWDEDENFITQQQAPWSAPGLTGPYVPNLLPLETQEVKVDQFNLPDANGWMLFIWPSSNIVTGDFYQTWMGVKYGAFGQFSAAMSGAVMANFNCFSDQVVPYLGVNYPYVNPADGYTTSPAVVYPVK